jgi:hypothetical protein
VENVPSAPSGIRVSTVLLWVQKPQGLLNVERTVYDFMDLCLGLTLGFGVSHPEHLVLPDHHAPAPDVRRTTSNNRILDATILHIDQTLGCQGCSAPSRSGLPSVRRRRCNGP